MGYSVVLASRDAGRGEAARAQILKEVEPSEGSNLLHHSHCYAPLRVHSFSISSSSSSSPFFFFFFFFVVENHFWESKYADLFLLVVACLMAAIRAASILFSPSLCVRVQHNTAPHRATHTTSFALVVCVCPSSRFAVVPVALTEMRRLLRRLHHCAAGGHGQVNMMSTAERFLDFTVISFEKPKNDLSPIEPMDCLV
jgi:hypothetical protein